MWYKSFLNKIIQPKAVAAISAFLIMTTVVVFIPVGMANNGEFDTIMLEHNLYSLQGKDGDHYFDYFVKDYGVSKYYNEYTDKVDSFSTQTIFISAAVAADRLFTGDDGIFDVRFLGFLQVLLCTFACYLFVDYLTYGKKPLTGYLIAFLAVLVLADTGYTAYFNSLYPNGMEYSLFLIAITSIFLIKQKRYNRSFCLILYGASAFLFLAARSRNAWAGMMLAVLSILLMTKRDELNYGMDRYFNKALAVTAGGLFLSSMAMLIFTPDRIENIHKYNAMSRGALKTSHDLEKTLDSFQMSRQFALLYDTTFYDKYPIAFVDGERFEQDFYNQFSFLEMSLYYVRNPGQFYEMLKISLENAYTIRPQSTGNFLKEAGRPPGSKTYFFSLYSTLKDAFIPHTVGIFFVWLALLYFFYIKSEYNVKIMTVITLLGIAQILIAILGSGDGDMTRNMFMFNVVFDVLNLLMLSSALNGYVNGLSIKRENRGKGGLLLT